MIAFWETRCCNDISTLSFIGKNNFLLFDKIAQNETAISWTKVLFWGAVPQQKLYIAPLCPLQHRHFYSSGLISIHQTHGGLSATTQFPFALPTQELFLKRATLFHMGPQVLCPLSHSFFPICQSEREFTHHLCPGSSHRDIPSILLKNNLNLQCVVLRNVQLKPSVARKRHPKPASLTTILKPCTWQSWVIHHIQALSYSISAALKPHTSHLCLHSANSPCMVLLRQCNWLRKCAHQCSKLSFFFKNTEVWLSWFSQKTSVLQMHVFFISILMSGS